MGSRFEKFEKLHGAGQDAQAVPGDVVESYRGRLPDDLLAEWQATGWCSYSDGFLWLVDPRQYDGVLAHWLPDAASHPVFLRTAFGSLVYWDGVDAVFFDVTRVDSTPMFDEMDWVFNGMLCRKPFLDDVMDRDYFHEALPRLGRPAVDECYGFMPPKALGGSGTPDTLERVKLREHLAFLGVL